jgi:hypothetical protein
MPFRADIALQHLSQRLKLVLGQPILPQLLKARFQSPRSTVGDHNPPQATPRPLIPALIPLLINILHRRRLTFALPLFPLLPLPLVTALLAGTALHHRPQKLHILQDKGRHEVAVPPPVARLLGVETSSCSQHVKHPDIRWQVLVQGAHHPAQVHMFDLRLLLILRGGRRGSCGGCCGLPGIQAQSVGTTIDPRHTSRRS